MIFVSDSERTDKAGGSVDQISGDPPLSGTRLKIAEAALETLKTRGFAGASAREIASAGNFNQALIFYHFGSIEKLMLAALELVSTRRMQAYGPPFEQAGTVAELAALARQIYAEDLENGYVTVLGEMIAGAVSSPELAAGVLVRIQPWIDMVERKLREMLTGSLLQSMLPAHEVAFAIIALYVGVDMLSHLAGDHSQAEALLDLVGRYAPLAAALLPAREEAGR